MALPVPGRVSFRTLLHTLMLVQEERLLTGYTVGGVPLAGRTAGRTAAAQLAYRIPPVELQTDQKIQTNRRC